MKITKLELKNFKRFDDLTIDMAGLVNAPKLVLLIGTNGSGKSSVFDAFEVMNEIARGEKWDSKLPYYRKIKGYDVEIDLTGKFVDSTGKSISHISTSHRNTFIENPFYGRTSIRQVPKLTRTSLGPVLTSFESDDDRPRTFIDRDNRFENDIEKIASLVLSDVFKENVSGEVIRERYIYPINKAFENIFGISNDTSLRLFSIKPPLDGNTAEILFEKGRSTIPYDYLSGGEKEVFNILLNLLTRCEYFRDSIYFLDEIDLHLNTSLQRNLLKEITENWIPDNCQLWTASHSLGFIDYANEAEHAAIIDLDNLDFDLPQIIKPSAKNNFDIFEIAVNKDFLSKIFDGKRIVFAENSDTALYNNLNIVNTIFFNAQNKADVFHKAKNNPDYNGLIDRDYLTDDERINLLQDYKNLNILNYYSIENYIYHPENLSEYYSYVNGDYKEEEYINSLKLERDRIKDEILLGVARARDSYPFYRENEKASKLKALRSNEKNIIQILKSNDFETFYKVFPAKDYGTRIKERQNLNPADLAKTKWFKDKIVEVLVK